MTALYLKPRKKLPLKFKGYYFSPFCLYNYCSLLMYQNKNHFPQPLVDSNIFHNDRPSGWQRRKREPPTNIITHLSNRNYSTILPNPEKTLSPPLSYRKVIPQDSAIVHERSEMIAHPSKISREVPQWFKGNTYKYYSRNQYNNLYKGNDMYTIDYPTKTLIKQPGYNRSEPGTPMSRRSDSSSDNFYYGKGTRQTYIRKPYIKKIQRELSPKIGSVQTRDFVLPRIPLKVGHNEYIDTHKAC